MPTPNVELLEVIEKPGLAEVAVSLDGQRWHTFDCDPSHTTWDGCAGWRPTRTFDAEHDLSSLTADDVGGDPFDLDDLGLARARYVRIRDLSTAGTPPTAGFDLDAVMLINYQHTLQQP